MDEKKITASLGRPEIVSRIYSGKFISTQERIQTQ